MSLFSLLLSLMTSPFRVIVTNGVWHRVPFQSVLRPSPPTTLLVRHDLERVRIYIHRGLKAVAEISSSRR